MVPSQPPASRTGVPTSPTTTVRAGPTTTVPPEPPVSGPWSPVPGAPWQWQLSGRVDESVAVPTYDVDLFETAAETVARLHAAGRHVICYVSVGTFEPQRPDAAKFPPTVLGHPLADFPDERWLDVRRLDVLEPLVSARFDVCRAKGFDAVEPDNVDAFANDSGFPISAADQAAFNRFVAGAAHTRGLSVGLKNDLGQIPLLVGDFDWALNEQCLQFGECAAYGPFIAAHKAVLHVEYTGDLATICQATTASGGFSSMLKHMSLDAFRQPCP
jgi:hypothetical protein